MIYRSYREKLHHWLTSPSPPPLFHTHTHTHLQHSPQWVRTGSGWCKAEVEKKETTASEVSQMEERERGGWTEWGSKGREEEKEGEDRIQQYVGKNLVSFSQSWQWGATSWSSLSGHKCINLFSLTHAVRALFCWSFCLSINVWICVCVWLNEWLHVFPL